MCGDPAHGRVIVDVDTTAPPRLRAECTTVQHETAGAPPHDAEQDPRPVAGTVRIMTDEPLEVSADPDGGDFAAGFRRRRRRRASAPRTQVGVAHRPPPPRRRRPAGAGWRRFVPRTGPPPSAPAPRDR